MNKAVDEMEVDQLLKRINAKHGSSYTALKQKQIQAVKLCRNSDVLAVLPTGYGKTIIIQALPYLDARSERCVVVANPLNAIIHEQKERFGKRCVVVSEELIEEIEKKTKKKRKLRDDPNMAEPTSLKVPVKEKEVTELAKSVERLEEGDVTFIIGHPEQLLHHTIKKMFMQKPLATKISHLVVDEAHVLISWGLSDFRPAYMKLGTLRSILPSVKVLALTATAPPNAQTEIKEVLCMPHASIVWESPDRANVYLEVKRRMPSTGGGNSVEESYEDILDPMLDKLQELGTSYPKTIIYLPLKWCGHTHQRAISGVLHDHPQETTVQSVGNAELSCLIAQYHAPQTKGMKTRISEAMKKTSSHLRILLASEAYGMGADAPDVRNIVHVGPPNTIERYVQEIGRCGRDGEPATATLYYNSNDIGGNVEHLHNDVREYCKLKTCRREKLLQYFGCSLPVVENRHDCCDNCRATCKCTGDHNADVQEMDKPVSDPAMSACAFDMLTDYFADENGLISSTVAQSAVTGLSESVAKELSVNIKQYTTEENVKEKFPLIDDHYVESIVSILETVRRCF